MALPTTPPVWRRGFYGWHKEVEPCPGHSTLVVSARRWSLGVQPSAPSPTIPGRCRGYPEVLGQALPASSKKWGPYRPTRSPARFHLPAIEQLFVIGGILCSRLGKAADVTGGERRHMTTEEQLQGWTGPSSPTEQDKQDRTERMIREAVDAHEAFRNCSLSIYAKGSYANNTNVRADSDVDVAVQCREVLYSESAQGATPPSGSPYVGIWTRTKLRAELVAALVAKFGDQVDPSGKTAIAVNSSTARVDADVVPCFDYRYYLTSGDHRDGTRVFSTSGNYFENYPAQHLANGRSKNDQHHTNGRFKKAVRILKRVENLMVSNGQHREVPSYFVECLVYNCPNSILNRTTWISTIQGVLIHIWDELQGDAEPADSGGRWLEVNGCKYLFANSQKWSRKDGRDFAKAAWNYLGFGS